MPLRRLGQFWRVTMYHGVRFFAKFCPDRCIFSPLRDDKPPQYRGNGPFFKTEALYTTLVGDQGQIGLARVNPQCTLPCQISTLSVYMQPYIITQTWQFCNLWGLLYPLPVTDQGQVWRTRVHP